ncbi:MAG: hypothetical protein QW184_02280 [Nanopusillaceae archaeon]
MIEIQKRNGEYIKNIISKDIVVDSYHLKIKKNFLEDLIFKINKYSQNIYSLEIYNENKIFKIFSKPKFLAIYILNDYINLKDTNKYYICYNDGKNRFLCSDKVNNIDSELSKYLKLDFLVENISEIYENSRNYFNRKSLLEMDKSKSNLLKILYDSLKY